MKFIREQTPVFEGQEIVSAERLFCGVGIPYIYKFFVQKYQPESEVPAGIKGEDVFKMASEGDAMGVKTLNMFLELLAATLQHLSAGLCPENGIILSGGILNSIKDIFLEDASKEDSRFFNNFYNNTSSIRNFMKTIPIYLCTYDELGLFGCMVNIFHSKNFNLSSKVFEPLRAKNIIFWA